MSVVALVGDEKKTQSTRWSAEAWDAGVLHIGWKEPPDARTTLVNANALFVETAQKFFFPLQKFLTTKKKHKNKNFF